jgi:hypothetical protein
MAMSKDERNRKRRETYQAKINAGLTRSQARSTGKAVKENPDLASGLVGLFRGIAKIADDAAQGIADTLTGGAKQLTTPTKTPKKRKTVTSKKTGKQIPTFENFVKKQKAKNPKASARQLKKKYREKGGTISNEKGNNVVSEVVEGFTYYGRSRNPLKYKYLGGGKGARYMYLVRYGLEKEGFAELETHYITLSSNEKLDADEIKYHVEAELAELVDNKAKNNKRELYAVKGLNLDSIKVEYAIDMRKK